MLEHQIRRKGNVIKEEKVVRGQYRCTPANNGFADCKMTDPLATAAANLLPMGTRGWKKDTSHNDKNPIYI